MQKPVLYLPAYKINGPGVNSGGQGISLDSCSSSLETRASRQYLHNRNVCKMIVKKCKVGLLQFKKEVEMKNMPTINPYHTGWLN